MKIKKNFIKCSICNKTITRKGIGIHLSKIHPNVILQEYYNKYLKNTSSEGSCKQCGNPTKFRNMVKGYAQWCSDTCWNLSEEFQKNVEISHQLSKTKNLSLEARALISKRTKEALAKSTYVKTTEHIAKITGPHSKETKQKISKSNKGKLKGIPRLECHKQAISDGIMRNGGPYNKGKKASEETILKMKRSWLARTEIKLKEHGYEFPVKGIKELNCLQELQSICSYTIDLNMRPGKIAILDGYIHEKK